MDNFLIRYLTENVWLTSREASLESQLFGAVQLISQLKIINGYEVKSNPSNII